VVTLEKRYELKGERHVPLKFLGRIIPGKCKVPNTGASSAYPRNSEEDKVTGAERRTGSGQK
jgi:hypothetical protein